MDNYFSDQTQSSPPAAFETIELDEDVPTGFQRCPLCRGELYVILYDFYIRVQIYMFLYKMYVQSICTRIEMTSLTRIAIQVKAFI